MTRGLSGELLFFRLARERRTALWPSSLDVGGMEVDEVAVAMAVIVSMMLKHTRRIACCCIHAYASCRNKILIVHSWRICFMSQQDPDCPLMACVLIFRGLLQLMVNQMLPYEQSETPRSR